MMMRRPRGIGGLARNLLLTVASLAIFLAVGEGAASFLVEVEGGFRPGVLDPVVGFRLRGNHTYTEVGGALVHTNIRGFRDGEVLKPRPLGGLRIVALGDSSTFGYGVPREETYPEILERSLSARLRGQAVEVINAGTPGWSSANGLAFLVSEGLSWKPDIVLVSFGYNEQLGSGPGAPHYDYDVARGRVMFHQIGDAQRAWVPPQADDESQPTGRPGRFQNFPRNLRIYLLLDRILHSLYQGGFRLVSGLKSSRLAAAFLRILHSWEPELVYRPLRVPVERNHVLEAYVTHLEGMVRECRKAGVAIVFVLQPRRAYQELRDFLPEEERAANLSAAALIESGRPAEAIARLAPRHAARPADAITTYQLALAMQLAGEDTGVAYLLELVMPLRSFTMNALMQKVALRLDVPIVPTTAFFTASERRDLFFSDRYHTRVDGYALVAEAIEKTLVEENMLGSGKAEGR